MIYQIVVDTNLFTKTVLVRDFEELKKEIIKAFGKHKVDWDATRLYLMHAEVHAEVDVTILGEKQKLLLKERIPVNREINLDKDSLDSMCTIRGKIVLK